MWWCVVVRGGTAQGIGRYAEGAIPGVHSDAAAVASSLRGAGWEVQEALDCSRHALLTPPIHSADVAQTFDRARNACV